MTNIHELHPGNDKEIPAVINIQQILEAEKLGGGGEELVESRLNQAQIDPEGILNFIPQASRNGMDPEIEVFITALMQTFEPSVQNDVTEMQSRIKRLKDAGNLLREELTLEEFLDKHGGIADEITMEEFIEKRQKDIAA